MLKKTVLGLAMTGSLAAAAALLPSEASAGHIGFGVYAPGFSFSVGPRWYGPRWYGLGFRHGGVHRHCARRPIRVWSARFGWTVKMRRRCWFQRHW